MTDRLVRAHLASQLEDEILGPILNDMRGDYAARIVEIASKELNPVKRERKITSLSVAIRILDNISTGIRAIVKDGELAEREALRTDKIEQMSEPARRLFGIAPAR